MRLLLDANLSPRRVGKPLQKHGHDVIAIAEDPSLDGLDDESVMQLAADEGRILVTRNSRDFVPICRGWAEANRDHAGVILIWSRSSREHGAIVRGVEHWIEQMPDQRSWIGVVVSV